MIVRLILLKSAKHFGDVVRFVKSIPSQRYVKFFCFEMLNKNHIKENSIVMILRNIVVLSWRADMYSKIWIPDFSNIGGNTITLVMSLI